jgi:archaellum component FlaF (FlaF/FlaG flagellin family)
MPPTVTHTMPCSYSKATTAIFSTCFTVIIFLMTLLFGMHRSNETITQSNNTKIEVIRTQLEHTKKEIEDLKQVLYASNKQIEAKLDLLLSREYSTKNR